MALGRGASPFRTAWFSKSKRGLPRGLAGIAKEIRWADLNAAPSQAKQTFFFGYTPMPAAVGTFTLTGNAATLTYASSSWIRALNARATSTYVTDGTNETYILGEDDTYPVTRGSVTFGYTTVYADSKRDRNSGIDRRLAGLNQVPNTSSRNVLKVDLPSTGTYTVRLAFGDKDNSQTHYFEVFDNTTSLFSQSAIATSPAEWADAQGNVRTEAAWVSSNSAQTGLVFSTTTFILKYGGGGSGSGNCTLAHLYIEKEAAAGSYTLTAASGSFTLTGVAAGLTVQRKLTATVGTFTLTGVAAGLTVQRKIVATVGTFTLTGNAATLNKGDILTATVGTFTLTGVAAAFTLTRGLTATIATFALTGNDAALSTTSTPVSTEDPFRGDIAGDYTGIKRKYKLIGERKPKLKLLPQEIIEKVKEVATEPTPSINDLQMLAAALEPTALASESQEAAIQMLARLNLLISRSAQEHAKQEEDRRTQENRRRQAIMDILIKFKAQIEEEEEVLLAYLM